MRATLRLVVFREHGVTTVKVQRRGEGGSGRSVISARLVPIAAYLLLALLAPITADGHDARSSEIDAAQAAATGVAIDLPFTREIGASGVVGETLALSSAEAGVPNVVLLEAREAFATAIDLDRDVGVGDRFYVRYRQEFTIDGARVGTPLLLWAELRTTAKGRVSLHRFRPRSGPELLWLANGEAAGRPSMRLPLDIINVSSGFGPRLDPLDKPGPSRDLPDAAAPPASEQQRPNETSAGVSSLPVPDGLAALAREVSESRRPKHHVVAAAPDPLPPPQTEPRPVVSPAAPRPKLRLVMHDGLDLAAAAGTPIYAASDGIVTGADANGRFGNWMRIDHAGKVTTVYGHLSDFAPGIKVGKILNYGELIGYVGSTGRSTAAHLHFEILVDHRAVDPGTFPPIRRVRLSGAELDRFNKQVERSQAERLRESN